MRVSDLQGALLDHFVLRALGIEAVTENQPARKDGTPSPSWRAYVEGEYWSASTQWKDGGPLIERFSIGIAPQDDGSYDAYVFDHAEGRMDLEQSGPTALIAIARCCVALAFGEEVEWTS